MKSLLLSGLAVLVLLGGGLLSSGCKKSASDPGFSGDWRLVRYTEGFSGRTILSPADSAVTLSLHLPDYTMKLNGNVYAYGNYSVITVQSVYNTSSSAIVFIGQTLYAVPQLISFARDTLNLSENAVDGNVFEYVKVF
jgi:hypothetical protein